MNETKNDNNKFQKILKLNKRLLKILKRTHDDLNMEKKSKGEELEKIIIRAKSTFKK